MHESYKLNTKIKKLILEKNPSSYFLYYLKVFLYQSCPPILYQKILLYQVLWQNFQETSLVDHGYFLHDTNHFVYQKRSNVLLLVKLSLSWNQPVFHWINTYHFLSLIYFFLSTYSRSVLIQCFNMLDCAWNCSTYASFCEC